MKSKFVAALRGENRGCPPIWFMRQAGRYHSHYQRLRARHSFMDLCKVPELACEVTMGPIEDFGFDAAILFSDLLFPLEAMGMGLSYGDGPKLGWLLREKSDVERLRGGVELAAEMSFQGEAMRLIRARLSPDKGLIGFVGAPFTLYVYAVEGSHERGNRPSASGSSVSGLRPGFLTSALAGLRDGRYAGFLDRLIPLLAANMELQARGGADAMALFDTCAGELDAAVYREYAVPALRETLSVFRAACPNVPVIYYSRGTGPEHWNALRELPVDCLGVDWRQPLDRVLAGFGDRFSIQGNIDPAWLHLSSDELEARLRTVFGRVLGIAPSARQWICGLGHGVTPGTPEENVRLFLRIAREVLA